MFIFQDSNLLVIFITKFIINLKNNYFPKLEVIISTLVLRSMQKNFENLKIKSSPKKKFESC